MNVLKTLFFFAALTELISNKSSWLFWLGIAFVVLYYSPGPGEILFGTRKDRARTARNKRLAAERWYEANGGREGERARIEKKRLEEEEEQERREKDDAWYDEQARLHDEQHKRH